MTAGVAVRGIMSSLLEGYSPVEIVKLETPTVLSLNQSESPMCAAVDECGRRAAPINSSIPVPVSAGEVFLAKRDETGGLPEASRAGAVNVARQSDFIVKYDAPRASTIVIATGWKCDAYI